MAKTVVALYDDADAVNRAVSELVDNGFSRDDISVVIPDAKGEYAHGLENNDTSNAAQGAGIGAGLGAALGGFGGLLVGLGALTIPGIGPVLAAGPLAAAVSGLAGAGVGAVAGGITGGLLGALVDMGIPEERAHYYAEGVRRGGTLLIVRTEDDRTRDAVDIVNRYHPIDLNERSSQWRESGWSRFDPSSSPYEMHGDQGYRGGGYDRNFGEESSNRSQGSYGQIEYSGVSTSTDYDASYDRYDAAFRSDFAASPYASTYTYDDFQPAYRYGYDLSHNDRYRGRRWDEIEPDVRRDWESSHPGSWERFKDSIRHAWEEIKDAVD
jgi:hypothetical protein